MKNIEWVVLCCLLALASCRSGAVISGQLCHPDGRPMSGFALLLSADSPARQWNTRTDSAGHFGFAGLERGKPVRLTAACRPDTSRIHTNDLILISRIGKGEFRADSLPAWQFFAADVDRSGVIDNKDVVMERLWILQGDKSAAEWLFMPLSDALRSRNAGVPAQAAIGITTSRKTNLTAICAFKTGDINLK